MDQHPIIPLVSLAACPDPQVIADGAKFHANSVCQRAEYNAYKSSVHRGARIAALKETGVRSVPNQHTSYCPLTVDSSSSTSLTPVPTTGLDTMWIVENSSSSIVQLRYLKDGQEVPTSGTDNDDDDDILKPGEWKAIRTFEGHQFVAREAKEGGRVLLKHTVGLIPIGTGFDATSSLSCPLVDTPPMHKGQPDVAFDRTPSAIHRPCNTWDVGFRNVAGCPLSGYYVHSSNNNSGGGGCTEKFQFHLGVDTHASDFYESWTSDTKFEGTFVGHTFSFRLAHDPTVEVERVTLAPTYITDCPSEPQGVGVTHSSRATSSIASSLIHMDGTTSQLN